MDAIFLYGGSGSGYGFVAVRLNGPEVTVVARSRMIPERGDDLAFAEAVDTLGVNGQLVRVFDAGGQLVVDVPAKRPYPELVFTNATRFQRHQARTIGRACGFGTA